MPIYEYRCADCGRVTSVLTRSFSETPSPRCRQCRGTNLQKLVSRVTVLQSDDARLERLTDPSVLGGVDEDDPKSVARWARRLGQEMGEDLGSDFDEMIERVEAGEDFAAADGDAYGSVGDDGADV